MDRSSLSQFLILVSISLFLSCWGENGTVISPEESLRAGLIGTWTMTRVIADTTYSDSLEINIDATYSIDQYKNEEVIYTETGMWSLSEVTLTMSISSSSNPDTVGGLYVLTHISVYYDELSYYDTRSEKYMFWNRVLEEGELEELLNAAWFRESYLYGSAHYHLFVLNRNHIYWYSILSRSTSPSADTTLYYFETGTWELWEKKMYTHIEDSSEPENIGMQDIYSELSLSQDRFSYYDPHEMTEVVFHRMWEPENIEEKFVGFWIRTDEDKDYQLSISQNQTYSLSVTMDAQFIYSENGTWEMTGPTVTMEIISSSPPADVHRYVLNDVFVSDEDLKYYDFFEGWVVWMRGF